jgi:hypothetical protein
LTPRNQINDQKVPGKITKNNFSMNSIKLSEVISSKPQVREESDIGNKRVAKLTKKLSATKKGRKPARTRKSQCQKDALWQMYKRYEGKTPSRETIENLAAELGLKEN